MNINYLQSSYANSNANVLCMLATLPNSLSSLKDLYKEILSSHPDPQIRETIDAIEGHITNTVLVSMATTLPNFIMPTEGCKGILRKASELLDGILKQDRHKEELIGKAIQLLYKAVQLIADYLIVSANTCAAAAVYIVDTQSGHTKTKCLTHEEVLMSQSFMLDVYASIADISDGMQSQTQGQKQKQIFVTQECKEYVLNNIHVCNDKVADKAQTEPEYEPESRAEHSFKAKATNKELDVKAIEVVIEAVTAKEVEVEVDKHEREHEHGRYRPWLKEFILPLMDDVLADGFNRKELIVKIPELYKERMLSVAHEKFSAEFIKGMPKHLDSNSNNCLNRITKTLLSILRLKVKGKNPWIEFLLGVAKQLDDNDFDDSITQEGEIALILNAQYQAQEFHKRYAHLDRSKAITEELSDIKRGILAMFLLPG